MVKTRGQDYKEKHKTRLKTNVKRTVLNNTKLRHFWAQIVSWAPIHARKTFIILAPGRKTNFVVSKLYVDFYAAVVLRCVGLLVALQTVHKNALN